MKNYLKWQARGAVTASRYEGKKNGGCAERVLAKPRKKTDAEICLSCTAKKCKGGENCAERRRIRMEEERNGKDEEVSG